MAFGETMDGQRSAKRVSTTVANTMHAPTRRVAFAHQSHSQQSPKSWRHASLLFSAKIVVIRRRRSFGWAYGCNEAMTGRQRQLVITPAKK